MFLAPLMPGAALSRWVCSCDCPIQIIAVESAPYDLIHTFQHFLLHSAQGQLRSRTTAVIFEIFHWECTCTHHKILSSLSREFALDYQGACYRGCPVRMCVQAARHGPLCSMPVRVWILRQRHISLLPVRTVNPASVASFPHDDPCYRASVDACLACHA